MVLPLTDFSGKNSVTCRDQAGQSQGDAVCLRAGWKQDRECQEPPNAAPSPETPGTEHTRRCVLAISPPAHFPRSPCAELWLSPLPARSRQQEGLPRPLPKSSVGLGYSDSAQRNVTGAGAGGGFKGLELLWRGRLGARSRAGWGKLRITGCRTMVGPSEMSPCPRRGGQAVPTTTPCCGRTRPLPLQSRIN